MAGLVWILLLFSFVVLHELGHALMARACKVQTREIILLPIGGLARLERMPSGMPELVIALAGPAVNLGLGMGFMIGGLLLFDVPSQFGTELAPAPGDADVGRCDDQLRADGVQSPAGLPDGRRPGAARHPHAHDAARGRDASGLPGSGRPLRSALVLIGFTAPNPVLVLIGVMVFFGAANESMFQTSRSRMSGRQAAEAMVTRFESIAPQDSLGHVADVLVRTEQAVFPVVDAWGRPAGALTRTAIFGGLQSHGPETAVLEVMEREVPRAPLDAPLETVLEQLQNPARLPVFVMDEERLAGIVTSENLGQMMEIQRALGARSKEEERSG